MWSLPAWTRACEKKLSGALARTQKPKSYPQEKKSPCGKKDPCFFPRARGIVPSLSGRKNPRKNQNFPTRFPKQDARSNFETKPDGRTRKLQARDWFFWIFWPNRNIFWIPYRISSSSPDLPTYEAKTHKEEAGPSQNCGRKKKFQPPPARGAGYVRDLDLGLIWKERYLSNYTSSPPHRMPLSPHYCWPRMPLF